MNKAKLIGLKKYAPVILTVLSAAGVIGTAVTSVKAYKKAEEAKEQGASDLKAYSYYICPVMVGVSTIACMVGAEVLNEQKQASLMSAYALIDQKRRDYEKHIETLIGEEDTQKLTEQQMMEKAESYYNNGCEGLMTCIDSFMMEPFQADLEDLLAAEYMVNKTLMNKGHVSLGYFYELLDIVDFDPIAYKFGWSKDLGEEFGYQWIDFHHVKYLEQNEKEYCLIEFPFEPLLEYFM